MPRSAASALTCPRHRPRPQPVESCACESHPPKEMLAGLAELKDKGRQWMSPKTGRMMVTWKRVDSPAAATAAAAACAALCSC